MWDARHDTRHARCGVATRRVRSTAACPRTLVVVEASWPRLRQTLREHAGRFTRYSIGSVVAFATSQVVFYALYSLGAGARASSILAMLAGVPPAYHLNRRWAFGREGRSSFTREVLPYLSVVAISITLATLGTELAEDWILTWELPRWQLSLAVTGAFAAVNGALFITKYVVFDRWLFASKRAERDTEHSGGPSGDTLEERV